MPRLSKSRHHGVDGAAVSSHLSSLPPLIGRPTRQPVLKSCFEKVRVHPVFVRQLVSLTPANLSHYNFRNHRQATPARSHASRNHRAEDGQLRRQQCGYRRHGIPSRLLLEAVPRKTLSHRHVSASSAAMVCLPAEETLAYQRHRLRQWLIPSPVPSSLRYSQIGTKNGGHPPWGLE
ncbi:hypothetical protein MRX96_009737 [Rhipicephalus microplus]